MAFTKGVASVGQRSKMDSIVYAAKDNTSKYPSSALGMQPKTDLQANFSQFIVILLRCADYSWHKFGQTAAQPARTCSGECSDKLNDSSRPFEGTLFQVHGHVCCQLREYFRRRTCAECACMK